MDLVSASEKIAPRVEVQNEQSLNMLDQMMKGVQRKR